MSKYIDPSGKILAHTDRIEAWRRGDRPAPINLEWDLTNRCSLGCKGCHFAYTHTRGPLAGRFSKPDHAIGGGDVAPVEMVKRALREASQAGVNSVTWTGGGEPTLHPAFDEIVTHAAAVGLLQGMYTHGGHIDERRGRLISRALDWVVISLDAANAADYAAYKGVDYFDRAVAGARHVINGGGNCKVGLSFLLNADNWWKVPYMVDLARSIGATYSTFRPMVEYSLSDPAVMLGDRSWVDEAMIWLSTEAQTATDIEYLPARFIEYRDWDAANRGYRVCHGVKFSATITPNGKVWVCPNRREFPDSCIGDLSIEPFADVWARHPGQWHDLSKCRALCRLHMMNRTLDAVYRPREHAEFI